MKDIEEKGYHWTPAGVYSIGHGGIGVYIKYHKYRKQPIRLMQQSPGNIWVSCPDRDLVLVLDTHYATSVYPSEGTYDEFVNLSPLHLNSAKDFNIDYFMVNYTQYMGKEKSSPRYRRQYPHQPGQSRIISDSGGFQIFMKRFDYLDPQKIVEWYNENVDIGLILDIPTRKVPSNMYEKLAKIQAKNTEIMMQHKVPSLELMNIFHGTTDEERALFRDICERDDINRLAVGGSYFNNVLNSIDLFLQTVLTGKKYKHYHVLGVLNMLQVVLLMRIASKGIAPLITSDSSTHIQEAVSKGYYHQPLIGEPVRYLNIGDKSNIPNPNNLLPCECAVCRAIKYVDVLGVINSNTTVFLLMQHNLLSTQSYIKSMTDIVSQSSTKDLKSLLKHQLANRKGLEETLKGLEFLDVVDQDGIEIARKKFRLYLGREFITLTSSNIITQTGDIIEDRSTMGLEQTEKENKERLEKVFKAYEATDSQHGKKNADSIKGHKISISVGKSGPGKKKRVKKIVKPLKQGTTK